jgi:hypothetical protein
MSIVESSARAQRRPPPPRPSAIAGFFRVVGLVIATIGTLVLGIWWSSSQACRGVVCRLDSPVAAVTPSIATSGKPVRKAVSHSEPMRTPRP